MKKFLLSLTALVLGLAVYSQTPIGEGDISGTWTLGGSPYYISGTTVVPDDSTLTIEAGVHVIWYGSYTMYIQGRILALGTETDSILFSAADPEVGFKSIRFLETGLNNDTSQFEYCIFEYGKVYGTYPDNSGGAIVIKEFDKVIINHCLFRNNQAIEPQLFPDVSCGGAIGLWAASPKIMNSTFLNNLAYSGGAIMIYLGSIPVIENNIFSKNRAIGSGTGEGYGGAVCSYVDCDPIITKNIFSENYAENGGGGLAFVSRCNPTIKNNLFYRDTAFWGGAIELQDTCLAVIANNTITECMVYQNSYGSGIDVWNSCYAEIWNTIVWDNTPANSQIRLFNMYDSIDCYYSDIMGGQTLIGGNGTVGMWQDCIDEDPLFDDSYHITWASFPVVDTTRSPCMDTGDPLHVDPDETRIDMGVFYFDQMPETPVAYPPVEFTGTSFVADWSTCFGALGYILDVAYDEDFQNYVEGYENLGLMDTTSMYEVTGLQPEMTYYYRVKACNTACVGAYSNTVMVLLEHLPDLIINPVRIYFAGQNLILDIAEKIEFRSYVAIYNITGQMILKQSVLQGINTIPIEVSTQVLIVDVMLNGKPRHVKVLAR